jgi:hypothetical protein
MQIIEAKRDVKIDSDRDSTGSFLNDKYTNSEHKKSVTSAIRIMELPSNP